MKKRLVAFIMAFAMVLTMVPIVALAEEDIGITPVSTDVYILANDNGHEETIGDGPETYYHYDMLPIRFNVEGYDWPIDICSLFNYGEVENCELNWIDTQSSEEPWAVGNTYTVQVYLRDAFEGTYIKENVCEINVHLVDKVVESAIFDDVSIYEFTDGYYSDSGTYVYTPMIYMSDVELYNGEIIPTTNAIEFSNDQRPAELLYDQLENPLKAGDVVNADVSIWGYNGKVNIEVLKADIIDEMTVKPKKVSIFENTNGYYDGDTYIYNVAPQFTVEYKDGSIGFETEQNLSDVEFQYSLPYYEKAIDDYFTYSWHEVEENSQIDENWTVGNTYTMVFNFIGQQFEYEVEILPSEIDSIEIVDAPKILIKDAGFNSIDYSRVLVEITYKDGSTEQKYCDELGINSGYGSSFDSNSYLMTINYQGKTASKTIDVITEDTYPVESIVIDESTLGSAYLIDGEYYFSPSNFDVIVNYKEGEPSREHIEKADEPVRIEKDGLKMTLLPVAIDYDAWTDGSHPFRVSLDDGFVQSNEVEVNVIKDVYCENIELITPQTYQYYKDDTLFFDCIEKDVDFLPFDLRGMVAKATMSNGDTYELEGNALYTNAYGGDNFNSWGSSNGVEFKIIDETDGYVSHISIEAFGKTFYLYDIEATESNITDIEVLNYEDLKDKISQENGTGLKFNVNYSDGQTKQITLGEEEKNWIGVCWGERGDVELTPVDESGTSGIRFSWYKVNGEYASIIWNNKLLRFEDYIVFLDTGKAMKLNSNLTEGTVEVSSDTIFGDVIDQLSLENRYKVEQQGMDIDTQISVNSTDASKDILKLANADDATIEAAYAIDLAYTLDGETLELTELGDGKVAIKIKLPDSLVGKDNIVVYREHTNPDGSVSVEEIKGVLSEDGKYITFESSKFSTFALGYKEADEPTGGNNGGNKQNNSVAPNEEETIAKTLDETPIAATVALLWSSGLCVYAVARKRKEIE